MFYTKKNIAYLIFPFLFLFVSVSYAKTTIDVMALYSPAVTSNYGSQANAKTTIEHMINVANGVYNDSPPSDVELRLVHIQESALLDDNATTFSTLESSMRNPTFQALRDQYGADIVVIYRPYREEERGICGLSYLVGLPTASFAAAAYAHVSLGGICPTSVSVHEMGHTQGLSHSHLQDDRGDGSTASHLPYSLGHGINGRFATIMAYDLTFNTSNTIYKHSSPNLDCNGLPCGINRSQIGEADAVLALTQFSPNVANYRESKYIDNATNSVTDSDPNGNANSDTNETALEEAKRLFKEAKAAFKPIRKRLRKRHTRFIKKRIKFHIAKARVRALKRSHASMAKLNTAIAASAIAKTAKNAARTGLINYINNSYRPALQTLKDARNQYRNRLL